MTPDRLLTHVETDDPSAAALTIDPTVRGDRPVDPKLFGKFCEHLGNNIYHGMEAQILFNPVFGEWHFRSDHRRPSGGFPGESDPDTIEAEVRAHHRDEYRRPLAYPRETDPDALLEAYRSGLAFGWLATDADAVTTSPDTGPTGERAQRIEVELGGEGIEQGTRLPLHRTREYEFRARLRALDPTAVDVAIRLDGESERPADESVDVGTEWDTVEGTLRLPEAAPEDAVYDVRLELAEQSNVVVDRLLLYPADHVDGADPEVVDLLRESDLPLLRWPGGNFVSGYDWRDGIGPVDDRPAYPNPAWAGLEYNLFGTDEFVAFCENVGCEPSICVNAGDGTPEEAAAWVEYCNGDPETTEMGRLRAEHGHPEPYGIRYWEIGNELYGRWQVRWTTPEGNADRYERFREAMLDADPDIRVTATGQVTNADPAWNDALLDRCGDTVSALSDHVLAGGRIGPETDPDELFHGFMGFSRQVGERYREAAERMEDAGVDDPRIDVTELQLFARFRDAATPDESEGEVLTPETTPTPETITEALYDATLRHEFARTGDLVALLTHSATVNHGGGLSKRGERVWAHPCHYGRSIESALAGKTPVAVEMECDTFSTETSFREIDPVEEAPAIDALAAVDEGTSAVTLVVVNRTDAVDSVDVTVDIPDAGAPADVVTLSGSTMYAKNTREEPERVVPEESTVAFDGGTATVSLPAYSMLRLTVPRTR